MTLLQLAKSYGLKSPKEVAELTNTPTRTLANWRIDNPQRLKAIMMGAMMIKAHNDRSKADERDHGIDSRGYMEGYNLGPAGISHDNDG